MADFTQEQIEDILTSDDSDADLARQLGAHWKQIQKVRKEHAGEMQGQGPQEVVSKNKTTEKRKSADGPTTGYRDAKDGNVETREFLDGFLPNGWHDTPAKCNNCDGKSHPKYVKFKE